MDRYFGRRVRVNRYDIFTTRTRREIVWSEGDVPRTESTYLLWRRPATKTLRNVYNENRIFASQLSIWFTNGPPLRSPCMRISIRPMDSWPADTVDLAQRRLEFALGRFAGRVRSLSIRLSDQNGPRGGADKKCLISVRLERPRKVVVVEDVDIDGAVAVSRAAERAARAVSRAISSSGDWRILQGGS